ncbi:hypothetical protein EK21DRAFT_94302 [Setomelanomma holmii]|uniref:Uncharacterized protein n=1 Tax=Setomelanomma holmii TaxID=210430 RepID=A0A9P4GWC6_9PLEO|nr:hypothetical protein EK21DRAFT_94302 [Setomelanomma holmii]
MFAFFGRYRTEQAIDRATNVDAIPLPDSEVEVAMRMTYCGYRSNLVCNSPPCSHGGRDGRQENVATPDEIRTTVAAVTNVYNRHSDAVVAAREHVSRLQAQEIVDQDDFYLAHTRVESISSVVEQAINEVAIRAARAEEYERTSSFTSQTHTQRPATTTRPAASTRSPRPSTTRPSTTRPAQVPRTPPTRTVRFAEPPSSPCGGFVFMEESYTRMSEAPIDEHRSCGHRGRGRSHRRYASENIRSSTEADNIIELQARSRRRARAAGLMPISQAFPLAPEHGDAVELRSGGLSWYRNGMEKREK